MKILVVGSGGREHALVWKICQSSLVDKVYAAPGNAGISKLAQCIPVSVTEIDKLKEFALNEKIDLTVVGPELPLVQGIVDEFLASGLKIFGPSRLASELEGSKAFAKNLLKQHGIPTPSFKVVHSFEEAKTYLTKLSPPFVIKADGLASGKGVVICQRKDMAEDTLAKIFKDKIFGSAGEKVVIEEFLDGKEVSVLALTDGKTIAVLEPAQDYKRLMDNNQGPNTGGMGSYSPVPFVSSRLMDNIVKDILVPTIHAMNSIERPYRGVLYAGLMVAGNKVKVLEFNVRFGDPETQPLMMRLKSDLVALMLAVVEQKLDRIEEIEWHNESAVCVVIASQGYPANPKIGDVIEIGKRMGKDVQIFHSGTAFSCPSPLRSGNPSPFRHPPLRPAPVRVLGGIASRYNRDGTAQNGGEKLVTAGGRVLGVTALGKDRTSAREKVYSAIKQMSFNGAYYRTDIAK
ncbi:MAG: phosphoribosylamine--glycine ligase [Planctomycetota bacterium]|nr:phosphoribosylamine--glycine ligase [Planctomycetota bacterium]MDI6788054.1 phosphoribosylamine--glycine ligase [Planctomycetota bacterium]